MKTLLMLVGLVLGGCAASVPNHMIVPVELREDVAHIIKEGKMRGLYVNNGPGVVSFAEYDTYAGVCMRPGLHPVDTPWTVELAPQLRSTPEICWRSLVFHELGHCLLGLPHRITEGKIMSMGFWDQCMYYTMNEVTWESLEADFWEYAEQVGSGNAIIHVEE